MKKTLLLSLALACPSNALADEAPGVFAALQAEIEAGIEEGNWHPAAVAAIRAQWADYKRAHESPIAQGDFRGARMSCGLGFDTQVKSIVEFSGAYSYENLIDRTDLPGPHLKIAVSDENRVFILMDTRRIPAVVNNKIIFFTDGELRRENAQFSDKPFATLHMEMIYKAEDVGWVMGPTGAFWDDLSRLIKLEEKPPKAGPGGADPERAVPDSKPGANLEPLDRNQPEHRKAVAAPEEQSPDHPPQAQPVAKMLEAIATGNPAPLKAVFSKPRTNELDPKEDWSDVLKALQ